MEMHTLLLLTYIKHRFTGFLIEILMNEEITVTFSKLNTDNFIRKVSLKKIST